MHRRRARCISWSPAPSVFTVASLVAGFATGLTMLLAARAVQGVGAALLLAGSLPVLVALVPGPGSGASMVGAGRGRRRGDRPGARRRADRAVLVAGDLPRPGADRRRRVGGGRRRAGRPGPPRPGRTTTAAPARRIDVIDRQRRLRARVRGARRPRCSSACCMAIEVWRYDPVAVARCSSAHCPSACSSVASCNRRPVPRLAVGGALLLASGLVGARVRAGRGSVRGRCRLRHLRCRVRPRARGARRRRRPRRRAAGPCRRGHDRRPPRRSRARAGADRARCCRRAWRQASNGRRWVRRRRCCSPSCRCPTRSR